MSDKHDAVHDEHGKATGDVKEAQPAQKKSNAVLDSAFRAFKGLFEFDLNSLISLADPEIRKLAESLASKLDSTLPHDSVLRSELTERLIGHIKSRIETVSEELGGLAGGAGEKVSDFLDMFTSAFYGPGRKGDETAHGKPADTGTTKKNPGVTNLDLEYLKWAQEAMAKCAPADAEALRAEILKTAQTRESLKKLIAEGLPKDPGTNPAPSPKTEEPKKDKGPGIWEEFTTQILSPTSRRIQVWLKRKDAESARRLAEERARSSSKHKPFDWLEDALNSPVKIGVFGKTLIACALTYVAVSYDLATVGNWFKSVPFMATNLFVLLASVGYCFWKNSNNRKEKRRSKPAKDNNVGAEEGVA